MKKIIFIILTIVLVATAGFFAFNSYIYNEKQPEEIQVIDRYRGTLSGEYVCLPAADQTGPQTLECMYGIRTDVGEYYAVDFNLMSQEKPDLQIGDQFSANGLITPIEMLSTDQWQKYDIEGIFSVTDTVEKL